MVHIMEHGKIINVGITYDVKSLSLVRSKRRLEQS